MWMERRTLVRLLGATTLGGIAGCSTPEGDAGEGSPTQTNSPTETPTSTPKMTETETETATPTDGSQNDGLVTVTSDQGFDATVNRIRSDIQSSPLRLMATVDHAQNAAAVDMELPPTTLLLFGNPKVGTALMQKSRTIGIDLPQKILVWEDGGQTKVTYNDPEYIAQRHGIEGEQDRLRQVRAILDRLAKGSQ